MIRGGVGNDWIYGQNGADALFGQSGNDSIFFDQEDPTVNGGSGIDRIEEARLELRVDGIPNFGTFDFGTHEFGSGLISRQFTIRNTGNIPINMPSNLSGFIVSGLPNSLVEGQSVTFTVSLDTDVVGRRDTWMRFGYQPDDNHLLNIRFRGNVTPLLPQI